MALISLRRTKAAEINRKTGNLRAVQLLLGTKIDSTVRYLGVEIEEPRVLVEAIAVGYHCLSLFVRFVFLRSQRLWRG